MNDTVNFEHELEVHDKIIYPNVGTSMMPMLREHRDLMIIEKRGQNPLKVGDAVLFKRDNKYILHRIIGVNNNPDGITYDIVGDNQWRVEKNVNDSAVIGILTAFVRDGVEISVNDQDYLKYVNNKCRKPVILFRIKLVFRYAVRALKRKLKRLKET